MYTCSAQHMTHANPCLLDRGQAIQIRQEEDDAVAGLFSQIGELYVVHHIWGKC